MGTNSFGLLGQAIFKPAHGLSLVVRTRWLPALFSGTPISCYRAWKMIENSVRRGCSLKPLTWAMIFIKIYPT